MNKLTIPYPIVVEGKYDRLRVLAVANANVIVTDGFGVFRKADKVEYFNRVAQKTKIIILTDSDGAGQVIRNFFRSILPVESMIHLYTPSVHGKGKRKSDNGILGVEDTEAQQLRQILLPYQGEEAVTQPITRADLYELGLSGHEDSTLLRNKVLAKLGLPPLLTGEGLAQALTLVTTKEELADLVEESFH